MKRPLFLAVLVCLALVVGCDKKAKKEPARALDVETMAFLSEARALHHEANIKEDAGDAAGAIAVLGRLVSAQRPHAVENVPEIDEVLADAWARIAELNLKLHDLDESERDIKQGLTYALAPTYFRGHLLEIEGILEESRATDFADAGKKEEAEKARARAVELLHEAIRVQEQVIGRVLGDAGKIAP